MEPLCKGKSQITVRKLIAKPKPLLSSYAKPKPLIVSKTSYIHSDMLFIFIVDLILVIKKIKILYSYVGIVGYFHMIYSAIYTK